MMQHVSRRGIKSITKSDPRIEKKNFIEERQHRQMRDGRVLNMKVKIVCSTFTWETIQIQTTCRVTKHNGYR